MNQRIKYSCLLLGIPLLSEAQEMAGFRTDNYAGVNAAFYNPAALSSSPFRVDVNLFGVDVNLANKTANLSKISSNLDDSATLDEYTGGSKPNTIIGSASVHLPSVSVKINDKLSVALLSRTRLIAGITDIDGTLLKSVNGNFDGNSASATLSGNANMRLSTTLFTDIGVSGSYLVYDDGQHRFSVGATLKYLGGSGNAYIQLDKIKGKVYSDSTGNYLQEASGSIAIGSGGIDFSADDPSFGFKASGLGADLGVSYEYRTEESESSFPYLIKASAALTDIGSVSYNTSSEGFRYGYTMNIPAGTNFNLDQFDGLSNKEIVAKLDSYPAFFQKTGALNNKSYRVALPHALQLAVDYHAAERVFIAANAQISMVNTSTKPFNPMMQSCYWLTPRYEAPMFAAYLPISVSSFSGFNVGVGLRAGPLYIGSNSVVRFLMKNSKQMDAYIGFRFGFKYSKPDA